MKASTASPMQLAKAPGKAPSMAPIMAPIVVPVKGGATCAERA